MEPGEAPLHYGQLLEQVSCSAQLINLCLKPQFACRSMI
jgi:hypothetical protein